MSQKGEILLLIISSIFFFIYPVNAGLLEDIANSQVDTVYELPVSNPVPDKNIQQSGHIYAWVDVVGFQNMAVIDGENFVYPSVSDSAIIKYDAWVWLTSNVRGLEHYNCYWCTLDRITKEVSTTTDGNNITATLKVTIYWHETLESESGTQTISYIESAEFQDIEVSPHVFQFPRNQSLIVQKYGGLNESILSFQNLSSTVSKYTVKVSNGSITRRLLIGKVQYTHKNVSYANFTPAQSWEQTGKDISHLKDETVMRDTNITNVEIYTPFGKSQNPVNISVIKMKDTEIKPFIFIVFYILIITIGGLYVMSKS